MPKPSPNSALALLCGLAVFACGEVVQERDDPFADQQPPNVSVDPEPDSDVKITLSPSTLPLRPGVPGSVDVSVTPADRYVVRMGLLGDTEGAYLNRSELTTDESGNASVEVTARTDSFEFTLAATVGGAEATIPVVVGSSQTENLKITPLYAGLRDVNEWQMVAVLDKTCAEVDLYSAEYTQSEGAASPGPGDQRYGNVTLRNVPTGRRVTVLLRGQSYVAGCRDGIEVTQEQEQIVTIALTDRPMQLPSIDFPITLGINNTEELTQLLSAPVQGIVAKFKDSAQRDLDALLIEMGRLSDDPAAFETARVQEEWDVAVEQSNAFTEAGAENGLSSRIARWIELGLTRLLTPDAIQGRLRGARGAAGAGLLRLSSVGGVSPAQLQTPAQPGVLFRGSPDDTLSISTQLLWPTSALFAGLGESEAIAEAANPDIVSMTDALRAVTRCDNLGVTLAGDDEIGFGQCDAACMGSLCEAALDNMWIRVVNATSAVTSLSITASGPVELDDTAKPQGFLPGFEGAWVGELDVTSLTPRTARGPFTSDVD